MKHLVIAGIVLAALCTPATIQAASARGSNCFRDSQGHLWCMVCDDVYSGRGCRYRMVD